MHLDLMLFRDNNVTIIKDDAYDTLVIILWHTETINKKRESNIKKMKKRYRNRNLLVNCK